MVIVIILFLLFCGLISSPIGESTINILEIILNVDDFLSKQVTNNNIYLLVQFDVYFLIRYLICLLVCFHF